MPLNNKTINMRVHRAVANLFMFCARTSGGRSLNGVVAELAEPERRATGRAVYRDQSCTQTGTDIKFDVLIILYSRQARH